MSRRQHAKLDAIARFLPDGEHKFLRRLVDYANADGVGAFPRRKTLVKETGKSRRWLEIIERRLVERGWLEARAVGQGCARRTFYRVMLPAPSRFEWQQEVPRARPGKQLRLPFEPVQNPAELPTASVDADRIQCDPQIAFPLTRSHLTPSLQGSSGAASVSDPKNMDPKDVQKEERPRLARRHSPPHPPLDLERLQFAKRNIKARLDAARERRRLMRGRR